jgi:hypothetical protein
MSTANPSSGAWNRTLWVWVVALTEIGLGGFPILFFGYESLSGAQFGTGCGGGIGILIGLVFLAAMIWGLVVLVAALGAFLFWRGSRWGPLLLIPVNLLNMYLLGSPAVAAGQLIWAVFVLALAAVPAIAVVLLLWPLWTRGRLWVRVVELVVLGAIAAPVLPLYASGVASDVSSALQPAPPPVAAVAVGHC